ncbi:hypothetical protein HDK90DRAFT_193135 [Phyllosticta capitalensis]|uniref:Uncharacterized protein n=1 Tax=Phyllosticta capitalensis TaxID=121624 RepID=A0ABR1YX03_9PEZI
MMITKTAMMDWDGRWLDGYTHGHGKRAWYFGFLPSFALSFVDRLEIPKTYLLLGWKSYVATCLSKSQKYLQTQQTVLACSLPSARLSCSSDRNMQRHTLTDMPDNQQHSFQQPTANSQHQGAKQVKPPPLAAPHPFFPAPAHIIRPTSGSVPHSAFRARPSATHAGGPKGKCRLIPHNFKRRSGLELGIRLPCVVADGG